MRQLDENERLLIELARDAHDPSDEDRARVRAALAARLGAVAGVGMAASLGASAKAAAAAGAGGGLGAGATGGAVAAGTLAAKLIVATVVVAAAVGVPAAAVHHARHASLLAVTASARSSASRQVTRATAQKAAAPPQESPPASAPNEETARPWGTRETGTPTLERGGAVPPVEARLQLERPPERSQQSGGMVARPSERAVRHAAPTEPPGMPPLPTRPTVPGLPTLADEARMVHDGVTALRAGDPARALALFDRHAVLFPGGALAEERDAERALALAELGRAAEAHAAAEEFLRAHPTSPLSARLRERLRELDGSPTGPANVRPTR